MTEANKAIARNYFIVLGKGDIPDELLTDDFTIWTTSSGLNPGAKRFQAGIRLFGSVFENGLVYTVDSMTAEDDRVAAEVHAEGKLVNGEIYTNTYMFQLHIRDGKVASVAEHFHPDRLQNQIGPLIQAALEKMAK